jgi:hypothetical protein
MAVLERPDSNNNPAQHFTLWMSNVLPCESPEWILMDSAKDRYDLECKARSLKVLLRNRRLAVIAGNKPPHWRPVL